MALQILSVKAERVVRELAEATGESTDDAIEEASDARLQSVGQLDDARTTMDQVYALLHEVDAMPTLDPRRPEEILGYDEDGLLA